MNKIRIIAEIAQGYEGNIQFCKLLVRAAASAEADIVKFQMVYADELAIPEYKYYDLFKNIELKKEEWQEVKKVAEELDVEICFDVFGEISLQISESIGINVIKVHPTDINNFQLLKLIKKSTINRIIIGTGGADQHEVDNVIEFFGSQKELVLMHGFQGYPTENKANQISRISHFKQRYSSKNIILGFADHVVDNANYSTTINAMAFCSGALYFEKHLSLGSVLKLEDYESSLSPDEFFKFSRDLRKAVESFGEVELADSHYGMSMEEKTYRNNIRRKIVTKHIIPKGKIIEESDIILKRGDAKGIFDSEQVIGKQAKNDINKDQIISEEFFNDNL
jgi:N,N'-diacetyllegionaminate synthase